MMLMGNLSDLEIRHLVALDAVANEGTFGRAAERLGYTQSAISQQIAALERIVDGKVFDRPGGPRPVELTPLGEQLLAAGRDLLARVDALTRDLDLFRTGASGRLTVGTFQSVSTMLLPRLVARFREHHADVELQVIESDCDDEMDVAVASGEVDLGFVIDDVGPSFDSAHLLDDPFVLVARPGQYRPGPVALADIAGEPMIGQHANLPCQRLNEAGLRAKGVDPQYVFRTNDNGTVTAMVRAGMGIAVVPFLCTEPEDPRVSLHCLEPPIPDRRISIAWRRNRSLSPAARDFIDIAVEVGREMNTRLLAAV